MLENTIKEIAREAGVSIATVSRALNPQGAKLVRRSTRNKILKIVKRADYRPSAAAKRLVTGKSTNIIVFLGTKYRSAFYSDYYMKLLSGIMNILEDSQYNLIVRMMKIKENRFDLNRVIRGLDIAGAIVCHLQTELEVSSVGIEDIDIPTVILNKTEGKKGMRFVGFDNFKAAYEGTKYVIGLGHRRIAIIKGPTAEPDAVKRFNGYKMALEDRSIPMNKSYIYSGEFTEMTGFTGMAKLMALKDRPTAVFCSNDEMAIGAFMRLKEMGLNCPKDVSIIGFDGIESGRYLVPALTTIKNPIMEMAEEAARALLDALEKNKAINGIKIFNGVILEGGTCGMPPSGAK